MTGPTVFLAVVLGLLAGGGTEAIKAPVAWFTSGLEAPKVVHAQVFALDALRVRAGGHLPAVE